MAAGPSSLPPVCPLACPPLVLSLALSEALAPFPQAGTEAAVITNQACDLPMEGKGRVTVANTPLIKLESLWSDFSLVRHLLPTR